MRWTLGLLVCCITLSFAAERLMAQAGAKHGLDAETYQLWERHWRDYAQHCARFEDEFLCCPAYNKRYPSSAGMSLRDARQELSRKVKVRSAGMVRTKTIQMPLAEAEAMVNPIPRLAPGQYGYLHSVEVEEVLDATSLTIEEPLLIDAKTLAIEYKADRARARQADDSDTASDELEHRYARRMDLIDRQKHRAFSQAELRLVGFSTRGLAEGQRWTGPRDEGLRILVVKAEYDGSERRPRKRLVAAAVDQIRWGLSETDFITLLEARGLDPAGFVSLIQEEMKEHDKETAQLAVFDVLLPPEPEKPGDEHKSRD